MVIFTCLVILGQFPEIIVICDVMQGKQAMACFVYVDIRYNLLRKFTCLIFHNPFVLLCPCVKIRPHHGSAQTRCSEV